MSNSLDEDNLHQILSSEMCSSRLNYQRFTWGVPSARKLAWHITDHEGYFISESSVYRILKACDLLTSPVFEVVSAKDKFHHEQ